MSQDIYQSKSTDRAEAAAGSSWALLIIARHRHLSYIDLRVTDSRMKVVFMLRSASGG